MKDAVYSPISPIVESGLESAALVVNDWATKKGWNGPITPEADQINRQIGNIMVGIMELTDQIERIRAGQLIEHHVAEFIYNCCGIDLQDKVKDVGMIEARQVAQSALMVTEISEMVEAVLNGKQNDDHCPDLAARDAEWADLFIRMSHFAGEHGVECGRAVFVKHEYNTRRPHMHGKKA